MTPPSHDLSRRAFLRQGCCAAVSTTGILSALGQLRVMAAVAGDTLTPRRAAAVPADYKALICLFLQGGCDATNLIVPSDASSYATYAAARSSLAIDRSSLLPLAPKKYADSRTFGLHSSAPGLQSLFVQGKLAVLANVGMLLRPTTLADYKSGNHLPPQLYSHSDQVLQWQSSVPDKPFETGWGGRLADLLEALNSNHEISMSITLNGANSFQRGRIVQPYAVNSFGVNSMNFSSPAMTAGVFNGRSAGLNAIMGNPSANALAAAFGTLTKQSIEDGNVLRTVLATAPTLRTTFPGTRTAANLAMVAKLISVSQALGVRRQIFFVGLGGWDTHGSQTTAFPTRVTELSAAMQAFYDATVELGVAPQVTTFTASDFGRSYVPNATGTDHGWGNHQLIMGGAVQGGDIYGQMPSLVLNGPDDTGRGRWIPSTSVDEYNATLARWFGVSDTNLPVVLPNIGRFAKRDLGFMA